jgi:hypothetical protein
MTTHSFCLESEFLRSLFIRAEELARESEFMNTPYDNEPRAMDAAARDQRIGTALLAVGWMLIIFDAIPAVFVWVGWRSGSMFWIWWTVIEGLLGAALLIAGTRKRAAATEEFAALDRDESGSKAA